TGEDGSDLFKLVNMAFAKSEVELQKIGLQKFELQKVGLQKIELLKAELQKVGLQKVELWKENGLQEVELQKTGLHKVVVKGWVQNGKLWKVELQKPGLQENRLQEWKVWSQMLNFAAIVSAKLIALLDSLETSAFQRILTGLSIFIKVL
ncbi:34850_t:CDS:2, partial [Gigaspora margarita]